MKIVSWNVAGINACCKKGLIEFMIKEDADIYCFQEVKANVSNLPEDLNLNGYSSYHSFAAKKGYSGVSVYSKIKPLSVTERTGIDIFDDEGRVIVIEFPDFFLVNVYFPHAHRELTRLGFKISFNKEFEKYIEWLEESKPVIIASDFNVAHKEIDLKNPRQNEKNAGFTQEERKWFDSFLNLGHIDTFRHFNKEPGNYTWWTYRANARERNIGWRIDYFVISNLLLPKVKSSIILRDVMGSDHCPIELELSL